MLEQDQFSHTGIGGSDPGERMADAGYVFQGNSQTLDHILVSGRMKSIDYDVVHINAEFFDQASDHDPQVVRIKPGK